VIRILLSEYSYFLSPFGGGHLKGGSGQYLFYVLCPPSEEVVTVVFIREWPEVDRVLVCVLSTLPRRKCDLLLWNLTVSQPSSTGKLPFSRPLSQTFSLLRVLPPKGDKNTLAQSSSVTYGDTSPSTQGGLKKGGQRARTKLSTPSGKPATPSQTRYGRDWKPYEFIIHNS